MIAERIARGLERRDLTAQGTMREPPDWLWDAFSSLPAYSGRSVTPETALTIVAVYAAVDYKSRTIGSLPLNLYANLERGRRLAPESRLWGLLHDEPNPEMAADEVWGLVNAHLDMWGNAFIYKERDSYGRVIGLWPLKPSRVVVGRVDGRRIFWITQPEQILGTDIGNITAPSGDERDILHIRGLSYDGLYGLSPIAQARQQLGTALAAIEYQGRFFANNARPSGVLETDKKLTPDAAQRLKESWEAAHRGLENAAKTAVLEDGVKWQQISLPQADFQFIEQQNLSTADVARIFGVPPSKLNAPKNGSMTYSTVEQENLAYSIDTVRPRCVRIEKSLGRDGDIMVAARASVYPEFDMDDLYRGDTRTRYANYNVAIRSGWLMPDEARIAEDMPSDDRLRYFAFPQPLKGGTAGTESGPDATGEPAAAGDEPAQPDVSQNGNGNTPLEALT